jgi:glycerol-3-phosphate acyltransferase PlsY
MMMNWLMFTAVCLGAYVMGSVPSALVYSRLFHGEDIRTLGDGNMGARNTKRVYGFNAGMIVALMDIFKGALGVLLAKAFGLPLEWQLVAGFAAILGHDFPVWAGFKGGQGFATTTGVFLALFPLPTLLGAVLYFFLFLLFHNSDLSATVGMGSLFAYQLFTRQPFIVITFIVAVLLFVPFKKWVDRPRHAAIRGGAAGGLPPVEQDEKRAA